MSMNGNWSNGSSAGAWLAKHSETDTGSRIACESTCGYGNAYAWRVLIDVLVVFFVAVLFPALAMVVLVLILLGFVWIAHHPRRADKSSPRSDA